jgi:dienelactone hydrolase
MLRTRANGWIVWIGCLLLVFSASASEPKADKAKPDEAKPKVKAEGTVNTKEVELTAKDGFVLMGTFYWTEREEDQTVPGVLLLHQMRGKRQDYSDLIKELVGRGYAVLAMDLRGHGESIKAKDGKERRHQDFEVSEFAAMVSDAELAVNHLREQPGVDADRIAIVGASIGANAALNAAAKNPAVKSVVLLSPGIEYHKIKTEPAMKKYEGAVFLAASEEDKYSAQTVNRLKELARGKCELKMYSGAGHGTNMFRPTKGDLQTRVFNWIVETLKE